MASIINVLMVGGRRAGKTSLLAATQDCCNNLNMASINVYDVTQTNVLPNKIMEMKQYFDDCNDRQQYTFQPDATPSQGYATYQFKVKVCGTNSSYIINFTDVPGGYYGNKPNGTAANQWQQIQDGLQNKISNSQVFLIAIDTPHLMEQGGEGHSWFNRVDQITDLFKTAFQTSGKPRLVLFVPMKCEKYSKKGKMKEVADRVKAGYADLITFLTTGDVANLCSVAIAPIFTLGGAYFFRFPQGDTKEVGEYQVDLETPQYKPEYCEQPLMLMLLYVITVAEIAVKNNNPIYNFILQNLGGQAGLKDLIKCKQQINNTIIRDEERGFVQLS